MKVLYKRFLLLLPILSAFVLSCSTSDNPAAPYGSTITISPSSVSIEYTEATMTVTVDSTKTTYTWFGPRWYSQYYTIVVKDENGKPMDGVKLNISYLWASPSQFYAVQLYDGGERVNSPFDAKTDKYGTYILRADFLLGVGDYKADIEVRSGANFGSSTFEVKKK